MSKSWSVLAGMLSAGAVTAMSPVVGWAGTTLLDLQADYTNTRLGADSLGNLNQDYGSVDATAGGSPVTMTNNGTAWLGAGGSSITATTMTPGFSGQDAIVADRIWQAGETLDNTAHVTPGVSEAGLVTITGSISVPSGSGSVIFEIVKNNDINTPLVTEIATAGGATQNFSFPATLANGDYLNFVVAPNTGIPTANVEATVVLPEPTTLGLVAFGLPLLFCRRRGSIDRSRDQSS